MSTSTKFTRVFGAVAIALIASATTVRPLRAQNSSTLTMNFGGFATPTGADFAASEIRGTVSYTIACGRQNCVVTMRGVNGAVTEPANTTALTNFQYSFDNGTTWTTLTTAAVTITPAGGVASGTTTGSFLVRYQLGWQGGANPYTPPGTYSFPVVFHIQQGV